MSAAHVVEPLVSSAADAVVVAVVRSGQVESRHRVHLAALDASGSLAFRAGATEVPIVPRSANKPLTVVGLLQAGLSVPANLVAIACASHNGEPAHVAAVRELLARARLAPTALGNPEDWPLSAAEAFRLRAAGSGPSVLTQNCSGNHASMLVTASINGWDIADYLDPNHPVQLVARAAQEALTGEPAAHSGIDGCRAPVHAFTLLGLARAYRRLARSDRGSPGAQVADAMREFPELIAGEGRDTTQLMRLRPGLIAKEGAEGVLVVAEPNGATVALKVEDGADRARLPALAVALKAVDVHLPYLARHRRQDGDPEVVIELG